MHMPHILKVNTPEDYCSYVGAPCPHPLAGVVDYSEVSPVPSSLNSYGVYGLFMHSDIPDGLTYGCGGFDHTAGTLICVAPGQIGGKEDDGKPINLDGWALLFHPDLLKGTILEHEIRNFSFFDYRINEALHMSDSEKEIVDDLMKRIKTETEGKPDFMQKHILAGYINVLLNHCRRFYNRQFSTRSIESNDILARFSSLLDSYFESGLQLTSGLPGVRYFATELNMSANYLSDLVKRTTGESAGNMIRNHIVRLAKNRLKASGNIAQTAYSLGFEYPQHFTRMFKRQTGTTPSGYLAGDNSAT